MAKVHFRSYIHNKMILFPQRIDKDIAEDVPVHLLNALVDNLMLDNVYKLYKPSGRNPYHPQMMVKVVLYAYMNNIYSCRRMESLLKRDVHFIYLAEYEQPDFVTINRFRNRVKKKINNIFTKVVLILAAKGLISLDVEYIDGTKIESKANKYTFVWRKTVEKNRARLQEQIRTLLLQVDDVIAQDNAAKKEGVGFTADLLSEISEELDKSLESVPEPKTKEERQAVRARKKQLKELGKKRNRLQEYDQHLEIMGGRNSYSKTDSDATFMHMKEDAVRNGQTKPGYNLQIATENQFITDFALCANRTDTLTLPSFPESFNSRYNHYAKTVVAGSGYGSEENYLFMDTHDIEAYVKYNYFHKEQRPRYTPNPFCPASLHYDKEQDFHVCPMGQHMRRIGMKRSINSNGFVTYSVRFQAERCEGCPLRGSCFKARGNRIIEVNHQLQQYKQKARELLTSKEGIRHRGQRCMEPEAVFGQTEYNKAYKRFGHFGKDKVNMDFAFFAIAFNIGKMCRKTNLRELKAPMEVLLVNFRCHIGVRIGYLKPKNKFI
ncbi:IS1182 family transposase [Prevotella fusca]|uniref:IS1182 family transposase n=1 Tax=Prevotella fusca TaxID=589436 RepID=UPI003FA0B9F0